MGTLWLVGVGTARSAGTATDVADEVADSGAVYFPTSLQSKRAGGKAEGWKAEGPKADGPKAGGTQKDAGQIKRSLLVKGFSMRGLITVYYASKTNLEYFTEETSLKI